MAHTTEELRVIARGITTAGAQWATSYQRAGLYLLLRGTRERAMHHAWNLEDQDALELLEDTPEEQADLDSWEEERRAGLNVCIARAGVITCDEAPDCPPIEVIKRLVDTTLNLA